MLVIVSLIKRNKKFREIRRAQQTVSWQGRHSYYGEMDDLPANTGET